MHQALNRLTLIWTAFSLADSKSICFQHVFNKQPTSNRSLPNIERARKSIGKLMGFTGEIAGQGSPALTMNFVCMRQSKRLSRTLVGRTKTIAFTAEAKKAIRLKQAFSIENFDLSKIKRSNLKLLFGRQAQRACF